jgi:transcriptional regulator with XRE-family HTH domain
MHCGKALMLLRNFKNKSQSDIAGKMKKTQQYVSLMEKQKKLMGKTLMNISAH